jgi:hypothetical protein
LCVNLAYNLLASDEALLGVPEKKLRLTYVTSVMSVLSFDLQFLSLSIAATSLFQISLKSFSTRKEEAEWQGLVLFRGMF